MLLSTKSNKKCYAQPFWSYIATTLGLLGAAQHFLSGNSEMNTANIALPKAMLRA